MALSYDVYRARNLAAMAHEGAVDKAGAPYILHPMRVAERLSTPEERVVGWLHDVVEDTSVTLEEIREMFGAETAAAVDAITHREGESWSDYLCRVKANETAKAVKLADLTDNMNLTRFETVTAREVARAEKYLRAMRFLMDIDN